MTHLAHQRCFNHASREAAARCPDCKQFFCRECITEHDDRVLCTTCLKKLAAKTSKERRGFASLRRIAHCVFGFFVAWFFFFLIGEILAGLPDSFHEGTVWQVPWSER
jgi:hypothetical protein